MAIELYTNNAQTTVAGGGYTSGSLVLNVASTGAPFASVATGVTQMHLLVWRVIAGVPTPIVNLLASNTVSGSQWAVAAEGADANALAGDFVTCILSSDGMDQIRKDLSQQGVDSSLPATTNQKQGNVYRATDKPVDYVFDGSAWSAFPRGIIKPRYVPDDESTGSTTYVDLSTLDSVTFSLLAASDVVIVYLADGYQVAGSFPGNLWNIINIDGSDVAGTDAIASTIATTEEIPNICKYLKTGLAAGSHTIKIRHKTSSGTAHWLNRLLTVQITS